MSGKTELVIYVQTNVGTTMVEKVMLDGGLSNWSVKGGHLWYIQKKDCKITKQTIIPLHNIRRLEVFAS